MVLNKRKITQKFWILIVSMVLVGCASTPLQVFDKSVEKKGSAPELNIESNASIGSTVFTQFDYVLEPVYELTSDTSDRIGLGGKMVLAKGTRLLPAKLGGKNCLVTSTNAYHELLIGPKVSVCLFDLNQDNAIEFGRYAPGGVYFTYEPSGSVTYREIESVSESPDSFKNELILTSVSSDFVEFMYREYVGNLARPAFSQNVKYTIDEIPTKISFKNAQIEILGTEGNSLRYKIISGF